MPVFVGRNGLRLSELGSMFLLSIGVPNDGARISSGDDAERAGSEA